MRVVAPSATHSPAYSLHKYWSRKPANVLAELVASLSAPGGLVIDPFCGSGVLLREAALLGREAVGFDVNPVAVALTEMTVRPPEPDHWKTAADAIVRLVQGRAADAGYLTASGVPIRYVVHEMVVICPGCQRAMGATSASRVGRRYQCSQCGHRLSFNFQQMVATRPTACRVLGESDLRCETDLLTIQAQYSALPDTVEPSVFDVPLIENSRTLVGRGMTTRSLFTPRNFAILCQAGQVAWQVDDPSLRASILLWITSSLAQCSRLIADRQGLTTGGPAWTVPGFWIPPLHLEANPALHLEARARRFLRGLRELHLRRCRTSARVCLNDAVEGINRVRSAGRKADLVFLDPPYGDSVPFVEFSALWNAFLLAQPDPAVDMAKSDRAGQAGGWSEYSARLSLVVRAARTVLKDDGVLITTFNNRDRRAWLALLGAVESADFYCESVWYQPPAVVSAKAQLSPTGSYTSDIYAIFRPGSRSRSQGHWCVVKAYLERAAMIRGGRLPVVVAQRVLAVAWLQENLPSQDFDAALDWMRHAFTREGPYLKWLGPGTKVDLTLAAAVTSAALQTSVRGLRQEGALYSDVLTRLGDAEAPDPWEVKAVWAKLHLHEDQRAGQMELFGEAAPEGCADSPNGITKGQRGQELRVRAC